jgi:hypothetical protein
MTNPLTVRAWPPYAVGVGIGLLSWFAFATADHLRLIQRCGFLASERDGRNVYYTITEPCLKKFMGCIRERFAPPDES